jgi:hypothetical protein
LARLILLATRGGPRAAAAQACVRHIHVVASVFTEWPHGLLNSKATNPCWSVYLVTDKISATCSHDTYSTKPQWWQFNEISSTAANEKTDRTNLTACYNAVKGEGNEPHGWLDYAYGGNGAWQLAGHVPPRIGRIDLLLELYSHKTDIASDTAVTHWTPQVGSLAFGAIVNYAGSTYGNGIAKGTDQEVKSAVMSACKRTTTTYVGLYAGSNEPLKDSATRISDVAAALNTCTTQP